VATPAWDAGELLFKIHKGLENGPLKAWKSGVSTRPKWVKGSNIPSEIPGGPVGLLGRLSCVEEPGKMRIVAMVDCFTQWILYPLHRFIFDKLLRVIPQDGTKNQLKPVKSLIEAMRAKGLSATFSFDLSAATDRIPVRIQEILLSHFTTKEFSYHWKHLLTSRSYATPYIYQKTFGKSKAAVKYAVGQPMGAYSSWAMLALVHHMIVQLAAQRAGRSGWFELYAVLGDDVVIGDRGVADQYTRIMEQLGVKIGFSKSIISNNLSLEFAKRFFFKGIEVTPLPLIGVAVGWLGVSGVPEIMKIIEEKTGIRPNLYHLSRGVGFGFKAASGAATSRLRDLPRSLRSIVLLLTRPGQALGVDNLWTWVRLKGYNSVKPATKAWFESTKAIALQRVEALMAKQPRKALFKAFVGFEPDSGVLSLDVQLANWWAKTIKEPYKAPMLDLINELDEKLLAIKNGTFGDDEDSLLHLLDSVIEFESALCKLPASVELFRNMLITIGMARVKQPKHVRMWRKLSKFGASS
jgi:hypothetical protein